MSSASYQLGSALLLRCATSSSFVAGVQSLSRVHSPSKSRSIKIRSARFVSPPRRPERWKHVGLQRYPDARALFITADAGGSNGYRARVWKAELQRLADKLGISIRVSLFPPGTSKWNKIEHRLFSFISINWRADHCARTRSSST
jgi:hypothetical protein